MWDAEVVKLFVAALGIVLLYTIIAGVLIYHLRDKR